MLCPLSCSKEIGSLPAELTGVWQIVDLAHGQDLKLFPTRASGSYEERHVGYSQTGLLRLKRGLEKAGARRNPLATGKNSATGIPESFVVRADDVIE